MPVTKSAVLTHTLTGLSIDMTVPQLVVKFVRAIDGVPQNDVLATIEGTEFLGIIAVPGVVDKPRGADITDAIYDYAITKGIISGTIA